MHPICPSLRNISICCQQCYLQNVTLVDCVRSVCTVCPTHVFYVSCVFSFLWNYKELQLETNMSRKGHNTLRSCASCYLTACRTSYALASVPAGRGNHSSQCSSSSKRWPLSCSQRTTASSLSHPLPAASQVPSASLLQTPTSPSPVPDSASSLPL